MIGESVNKNILLLYAGLALAGFALGWYLASKQQPQSKTEVREVNHTITKIVTVKQPNGETETTTTIDSSTKLDKTAIVAKKPTTISALVGNDFSTSLVKPLYGISVTKQIIGPITAGVFGLNNGIIGLSIGWEF